MDQLGDLLDSAARGHLSPDEACARLDRAVARHYGGRSRDAGVVYTPGAVARYVCRRAIAAYGIGAHPARPVRVLDSSCGTGIFLEAAMDELYAIHAKTGESEHDAKKAIVEQSLFGMDVDPYSIEAASLRLRIRLAVLGGDARPRLACDNALFAAAPGKFDVIVGNPPYRRIKSMAPELKNALPGLVKSSRLYRLQRGNLNLYKLFIERNLGLLEDGGSMGLIVPASFLNEASSEPLRKHLFSACTIDEVTEIPEHSRIFPGVSQAAAILVLRKTPAGQGHFSLRAGVTAEGLDSAGGAMPVSYGELADLTDGRMEVPLVSVPELEWDMLRRLKAIPPFRGGAGVAPVGEISVGNVDETIDKALISRKPTGDLFVKGIHLREYAVDLSPEGPQPRWIRLAEFLRKRPSAARAIGRWRLIGRNTQNKACARRLKFAVLPPGYACGNSVKQVVVTDGSIDPLYLLGLLNSSTLNWYFELFCSQNNVRNYRIGALPIVRAPGRVQAAFADVARRILGAPGDDDGHRLMDAMAFGLYFGDPGVAAAPGWPLDARKARKIIRSAEGDRRFAVVTNATYGRKDNI